MKRARLMTVWNLAIVTLCLRRLMIMWWQPPKISVKWPNGQTCGGSELNEMTQQTEATAFEITVANAYRDLGARVQHNKNIGGLQVDVYVEQFTPDGCSVRTAVECKFYAKPVTLDLAVA